MPLGRTAESLRWARQLLRLVQAGVVNDGSYAYGEDHLVELWLAAAPMLRDRLAEIELAPLARLPPQQRDRMTETLRAWLDTGGNAVQMAHILNLHPQTVRYRLRNLDRTLGTRLSDPGHRLAVDVVLRTLAVDGRHP